MLSGKVGRPPTWEASLKSLLQRMRRERYCEHYMYEVDRIVRKSFGLWGDIKPADVEEDHIYELLDNIGGGVRNQKYYRAVISKFLSFNRNYIVREIRWRDPQDIRIHVNWLNEKEIEQLLSAELDPRERLIVHLGLYQACRRVEIMRLKLSDIHEPYMDLTGKSHKRRTVPFSPDTRHVLEEYMELRDTWNRADSPYLIIGPKCRRLSESNARRINLQIVDKSDVQWTYHDLRRTWGRTAWENGIPLESIGEFLGHSDTRVTIKYLGIKLGDLDEAADAVSHFYNRHKVKQGMRKT